MSKNIVLVEDEFLIAMVIKRQLSKLNHQLMHFPSGEAFLSYLEQGEQIDLLILDITLKEKLTGLDVFKKLIEKQYQIPVIFTTGNVDAMPILQEKQNFPVQVFIKPVEIEKLMESIQSI